MPIKIIVANDGSVDAFDSILWELNNGKYQELD